MSIISSLFGVSTPQNNVTTILSPTEFKAQISNSKVQLIDVRTPKEFVSGHIDKAINIDFYSDTFESEFNKLDKNKAVYIYCRSGSRSRQSAKKLVAMGFTEIYDLQGGILNYN